MPIYEYGCESCGKTFEVWQKISDPEPKKCEHCGSKKIMRHIGSTSFQLKGDGWYLTDYARKGGGDKSGGTKNEAKSDKTKAAAE